jgi:SpoIID/LytB domain protein
VRRPRVASVALVAAAIALAAAVGLGAPAQPPAGAAWFVRSFDTSSDRRESRPDVLDAPMLPGSVMKAFTLAAALESHTIEADTSRLCRRVVTLDGRRYTCSHPDLKRALTPAEALAHSCNDFFVSLAPRLPRAMVNEVRTRVGLPPIAANANYAAALVGLDGPRVTPRALLDVFARLAGADRDRPVSLSDTTRRVLLEGLRGAATYGSASELGAQKISALAKTGTAPMPGGGAVGILVALTPADKPTRGVVVVAPGAAGRDASFIAAELLAADLRGQAPTHDSERGQAPTHDSRRSMLPAQSPALRIGITSSAAKTRVESLALEDYVARVLAGEGQPRAAEAAQQALAIAIRTFALANRNRHRREGFDLCDTTHCQVWRAATATTRRAAEETAGRVLVHQNQPATIFYSAWCGGHTELASQVWPGAIDYAFAPAQEDEVCRDEPGWRSEIDARDIERALRLAGLRGDRLRNLRVAARNASGRVSRLRAEGFTPAEVTGDDFRMAIGRVTGWQNLKSTMFEMRRISNGYVFIGRGFGHGVGMCVVGAGARAARGRSADEILRFYYPGLRVQQYTPAALTTTTAPKPPAAPVPSARAADVLVALPAGEESERTVVMQMVRRARDEIAAKTGVKPPAAIRVTVHPSVESFGRTTGQPWWVSGATDQSAIDLLPLTVLQQRGQFERTIRHEVAHVLIDAALANKPMWVREGAALYFSNPAPVAERPDRVRCPEDAEFLRPISAGAHRDAYARAEACFRRQVLDGKTWQEIK